MKIDEIDWAILSELQRNSRLSIRELSKKVSLSPPSVAERVRRMEDQGIIEGYTIQINKQKLDLNINCLIEVKMRNGEYERFIQWIKEHPRSEWCYRVAGEACFMVLLTVANLEEIEQFINQISSFAMTKTMIAFKEVPVNRSISKFFINK